MRLSKLQRMDPIEFERFTGQLFRKMGFRVEDTQASADEGIDLILRRRGRMAVVQCKRYQGSVGQPVVRDLYGVMQHTNAAEAYLVTTGSVTRAARRWAEDKPIHLVDSHRLVEWVRTGRLLYDKPSALRRSNRQLQYFIGLLLLTVLAVYAIAPDRILQLRNAITGYFAGPVIATATAVPTPAPTPPLQATDTDPPIPTRMLTTATPFVQKPTAPAGLDNGRRPGPTAIVTQPAQSSE